MALKKVLKNIAVSVALLSTLLGNTYFANSQPAADKKYQTVITEKNSTPSIDKVYLTSCVNGQTCSTNNKEIKLEDEAKLNAVVEATVDGKKVYFSEAKNVIIKGKKIDTKPWTYEDATITWYKVEAEKSSYNNWDIGKFIIDLPTYKETKIIEGKDWSIIADAKPTDKLKDVNEGLGTMRYKVEVFHNNKTVSTPGKKSINAYGINNDVHRIHFRKDDSFIGWMTSFFNIPYIMGSVAYQVDNYIGIDCADFVIASYNKTGHKLDYTDVKGLYKYSNVIAKEKHVKITNDDFYHKGKPLIFGKDVKEGDLLVFDDCHVGVLYKDKSNPNGEFKGEADGILNQYDIMLHIESDNPKEEVLNFCTRFSILRLK